MHRPRVIPIISLIENRIVSTQQFKSPIYIGDPINTIKLFNDKYVDEIILLDIRSSFKGNLPNYKLIESISSECFMPLSYGGAIKSLSQAKEIFDLGIEKIILNSICYENIKLISEISTVYGSQSVVVSLDYKINLFRKIIFNSQSLKKKHKIDLKKHLKTLEGLGMGELLITCINNNGRFSGYDYSLSSFVKELNVPTVINGGLSSLSDMKEAFSYGFNAVAGTSFFVFQKNNTNSILISYPNSNNIKELINEGM